MNTRFRLIIIGIGALLVAAVFTFPLWRPLFVNDVVDEAFPGLPADKQDDFRRLPADQQAELLKMKDEKPEEALDMAKALTSGDKAVPTEQQAMPTDMPNPVVVSSGSFIQIDVLHGASGKATLYQLPNNRYVLRFEDFRATNGPDLHVYLVANPDPRSRTDIGAEGSGFRDLGRLKGNVGNQNYDIPGDVEVSRFQSVVIYCVPFGVVFSTATLG